MFLSNSFNPFSLSSLILRRSVPSFLLGLSQTLAQTFSFLPPVRQQPRQSFASSSWQRARRRHAPCQRPRTTEPTTPTSSYPLPKPDRIEIHPGNPSCLPSCRPRAATSPVSFHFILREELPGKHREPPRHGRRRAAVAVHPPPSRRIQELRNIVCIVCVQGIEPKSTTETAASPSSSPVTGEIRPLRSSFDFPKHASVLLVSSRSNPVYFLVWIVRCSCWSAPSEAHVSRAAGGQTRLHPFGTYYGGASLSGHQLHQFQVVRHLLVLWFRPSSNPCRCVLSLECGLRLQTMFSFVRLTSQFARIYEMASFSNHVVSSNTVVWVLCSDPCRSLVRIPSEASINLFFFMVIFAQIWRSCWALAQFSLSRPAPCAAVAIRRLRSGPNSARAVFFLCFLKFLQICKSW
jgi:hypothetical protein